MSLTLETVSRDFASQIKGAAADPDEIRQAIQAGERSLSTLLPAERVARMALLEHLRALQFAEYSLNNGLEPPKWLDMSFMKLTTRAPNGWMVPQFALVNILDRTATCEIEYPNSWDSPDRVAASLVDIDRLSKDISFLGRLFSVSRRICYAWSGNMPSDIRGIASIATSMGSEEERDRMDVYLVCDTQGRWNCTTILADPLLVARVKGGDRWLLLGQFDPAPRETWIANEFGRQL